MFFSIIIPVYNRPDEIRELLQSLTEQTNESFEIIVVEDGSEIKSEEICETFSGQLDVKYFYKENSGPGDSRNFGAQKAKGDYLLILDSDCIIPQHYLQNIQEELQANPCDAFGGPDAAHKDFSAMQKAVNYAMTSFFTTGGIRGGKKDTLEKFHPRSFNMGIKTEVYKKLGGFSKMRYGEDIDFSIRLFEAGYNVRLFPNAYVYHKRRTDLSKFYKQVFHSGEARIILWKLHPKSLKLIHFLPSIFVVGTLLFFILGFFQTFFWCMIVLYCLLIAVDSTIKNKDIKIGFLSVVTSFTQLFGYGVGFLKKFLIH